jgi:hypothetical protein
MGMGFRSIAETGAPTLFENLVAQKLVDKNFFHFI